MLEKIVNVLDQGADPGGVHDSTEAFRKALELSTRIEVPRGVYRLSGVLEFGATGSDEREASEEPVTEGIVHES